METQRNSAKNILCIAVATAVILLISLLAGWPWTVGDYVVMGILLLGTGLIYELIARRLSNSQHRAIAAVVLLVILFLIWVELAVGIFGSPFAGQ